MSQLNRLLLKEQHIINRATTTYTMVKNIAKLISTTHPTPDISINVRLCIYEATMFTYQAFKGIHLSLINEESANDFVRVKSILSQLDKLPLCEELFRVTIWGCEDVDYFTPGMLINLTHIHTLHLWQTVSPQGSITETQFKQQKETAKQPTGTTKRDLDTSKLSEPVDVKKKKHNI